MSKKAVREVDLSSAFSVYLRAQYPQYIQVFTDGSKDSERQTTGAAFLVLDSGNQSTSGIAVGRGT